MPFLNVDQGDNSCSWGISDLSSCEKGMLSLDSKLEENLAVPGPDPRKGAKDQSIHK